MLVMPLFEMTPETLVEVPSTSFAAAQVLEVLKANSIFNVLDPAIVPRRALPLEGQLELCDADGRGTGVAGRALAGQESGEGQDQTRCGGDSLLH